MPILARLYNGKVLEFPDDTPMEVVNRVAQEQVDLFRAKEQPAPTETPVLVKPSTERTWGQAVGDIGASALSGVGGVLAFPGQVASLVPGLRETGEVLATPGEALQRFSEGLKSEGLKVREALRSQAISEAEKDGMLSSFATAITSTLKDPALISSFLAEQVPLLFPPAAVAKLTQILGRGTIMAASRGLMGEAAESAAKAAAERVNRRAYAAALGTGATMQGADISSDTYQRAYQAALLQGKPPEQAADEATNAARLAFVPSAATTLLTQRIPGARAIESRMAGLPGATGRVRSAFGEATQESLEEGAGALFGNLGVRTVDPNVSLTEGVGAAAGLGALGGGFFGAMLGKKDKPALAPGQREGESIEQTINRLVAERQQLMAEPEQQERLFPTAVEMIEMINRDPARGYDQIVNYVQQLRSMPASPEQQQALATAEELRQRLSVEQISRMTPSNRNVITGTDLRNTGLSTQDPVFQELNGKDLAKPDQAVQVLEVLKRELERSDLSPERYNTLTTLRIGVDNYLTALPGSAFYAGELDAEGLREGTDLVQQPGGQPAQTVGTTERDGVAPAGEPSAKVVARTKQQPPALVFETSRGSTYAVDADGKTSRTKRSPGRGQGETYPPHEAFYVSQADADQILDGMRTPERRSIQLGYRDGNLFRSIATRAELPQGAQTLVAVINKDTNQLVGAFKAELTPKLGLAPVEKLYMPDGMSSTHIGHPIIKIGKGRSAQVQNPVTKETLEQYGIKPNSAVAKRILGKSQDDSQVQEELSKFTKTKPSEKPKTEEIDESLKLDGEAIFGTHAVAELPIQYMLVKALKLSSEVPQFKGGADENGVVQKLTGKFDWRDLGPIQVWQRKNGAFEVISGRHRFDLAKANNIQYLPVQIHKEADGFDVIQAKILDAELNIRDGYGKVKDYVNYFQGTQISREEAQSRGLLGRDPGKRGFDIANNGSPEIIAAHRADRITDQDAALVANAAPNDGRLQAIGLKVLEIDKKNGQAAVNTMKGVKAVLKDQEEQGGSADMFGFDDSLMKEAEELAAIATRKQDEISRRISVLNGVTKNPKIAAQEGIDVKDPAAVKQRIAELRQQRAAWDRWETNPDLIAEIRRERSGVEETAPEAPAVDTATDAMFSLRPEEMEARYRELEARARKPEAPSKPVAEKPETPEETAKKRRIGEIDKQLTALLTRLLNQYGLNDVGVELIKNVKINGSYANHLIRLADDTADPVVHLRHESIHALKELNFFTPQQWKTLEQKAKDEWVNTYLKNVAHNDAQSRYDAYLEMFKQEGKTDAEAEQAIIEEAIADAFSYFHRTKAPAGLMQSILKRLNNFFSAIKEFLRIGNLSADQIFGKIEAGELKPVNDKTPAPVEEPPRLSLRNVPKIDKDRSLNAKRISPRFPTAVKATEDVLGPVRLQPDLETFKRDPVAFRYNIGLMSSYPNFTDIKGTADQRAEQMINRMRDNLLWLYKHWDTNLRDRSKLWYVGGNRIAHRWAEKYGIPPETAAAIIASLSPQKDWFQNVSLAERTLDALIFNADTRWDASMDRVFKERAWAKKFPVRQYRDKTLKEMYVPGDPKSLAKMAVWIRAWDEGHNPQTARVITPEGTFTNEVASGKTGKPIAMRAQSFAAMVKTLQILQDSDLRNFSELIGKNHKVRSFYNNIIAPFAGEDVTIDTHAVAAALMRPLGSSDLEVYHNFGSAKPAKKDKEGNILVPASKGTKNSAVTGLYGTYAMYAEAYRRAAADARILPREMQSITWEAIRGLFRPEQKQAKLKTQVTSLWNSVAKGKLNGQEAREQISKLVSGIEDPAWVKSPAGSNDSPTDSSYATELPGVRVSGRESERVPSGTGKRTAGAVPKLSLRAQTQTPEFKQWFGDSQVVDANGEPLVVYHGMPQEMEGGVFRETKYGTLETGIYFTSDPEAAGRFATGIRGSSKEPKLQGNILPVYLRMETPFDDNFFVGNNDWQEWAASVLLQGMPRIELARWVGPEKQAAKKLYDKLKQSNATLRDLIFMEGVEPGDAESHWGKIILKQIRDHGAFDGIILKDSPKGFDEYVVFRPEQVKSAIGNVGTFSPTDPDIRYSLRSDKSAAMEAMKLVRKAQAYKPEEGETAIVFPLLFHSGTGDPASLATYIEPQFGSWVAEVLSGATDEDVDTDNFVPLSYYASKPAWVKMQTARKLNKPLDEITQDDIRKHGQLAIVYNIDDEYGDAINNVYQIGPDGYKGGYTTVVDVYGKKQKLYETDLEEAEDYRGSAKTLFGVEPGDIVSKDAIEPDMVLVGDALVDFLEQYKTQVDPDIRFSLRSTLPANTWNRVDMTIGQRVEQGWVKRITDAISPRNWSSFRDQFINHYEGLAVADRIVAQQRGGIRLLADESAEAAALFSDLGAGVSAAAFGVHDRIGGYPVFQNGVVKIENQSGTVKGPLAIFSPLAAYGDPDVYRLYQFWVTAQRGQRLNADGRKTPFTTADMTEVRRIDSHPELGPLFKQVHQEWIKYNDGLVKFMEQTGVITPEAAAEFKLHGDYFPMYKYMEMDDVAGPRVFASIANVPVPKKLKGDDINPMGDFFENVVRNTQSAIQMGIKNIAAKRATAVGIQAGMVRNLGTTRPARMDPNYYRVLENGKEVFYATDDILFMNAIKSLQIPEMPWIGLLSGPANLLRNMVTKTPDFMGANMLRDSVSAWVSSGVNMTPVVATLRNFGLAIAEKSPELNALRNSGILGGYDYASKVNVTAKQFAKDLRKISNTRTSAEKLASPFTSIWEALEKGSSASDAATRMEIYKKTLAETNNEAEALFKALEVMNFNRKGRNPLIRILTAAVPFLNARIQGLDVLYRAGIRPLYAQDATQEERAIAKTFFRRGMTIMALSMAYWALTHDDDEYKRQEQETRDNYWLIPSMGIKIPIPFEIGVIFKVLPERIAELAFGDDTSKDFAKAMARHISGTFAVQLPQVMQPALEAAVNYNMFTQRPILSQGLEDVQAPFQVGPTTSRTAQEVASFYNNVISLLPVEVQKTFQASPVMLEHLVQGYTGTMGTYAMQAIDAIINANSDVPSASKRFEQMPVIKRFALDPAARGTVTSYYELKNSVDEVVRTTNLLERTGQFDKMLPYVRDNMGLTAIKSYISDMEKTMKEIREMKTLIRISSLSADAKRDQLMNVERLELALTANIQQVKKRL